MAKRMENLSAKIFEKVMSKLIIENINNRKYLGMRILTDDSMHGFVLLEKVITVHKGKDFADAMMEDIVSVVTKIGVRFMVKPSSDKDAKMQVMLERQKEYIDLMGENCKDFAKLGLKFKAWADSVIDIMKGKCSDKTMDRIMRILEYFTDNATYRALHADPEIMQQICVLSRSLSFTIQQNMEFISKRREQLGVKELVVECIKSQFKKARAKMAAKGVDIGQVPESLDSFEDEHHLDLFITIHEFIMIESGDRQKADDLTRGIIKILIKFAVHVFCEGVEIIETEGSDVAEFVKRFTELKDTMINKQEVPLTVEKLEECEELLSKILRIRCGGKTLDTVKSVFYYLKKDNVLVTFYCEDSVKEQREKLLHIISDA